MTADFITLKLWCTCKCGAKFTGELTLDQLIGFDMTNNSKFKTIELAAIVKCPDCKKEDCIKIKDLKC